MYQRILVPVDGSSTSTRGLDEAIELAKLTGANLRLIHVVDALTFATGSELYGAYAGDLIPKMREFGEQILEDARTRVQKRGVKVDSLLIDYLPNRLSDTRCRASQGLGCRPHRDRHPRPTRCGAHVAGQRR